MLTYFCQSNCYMIAVTGFSRKDAKKQRDLLIFS